jgi:hypothetical protein
MAIKFNDLALNKALDRKALQSIQGALCWVNGAFPCWVAPVAVPGSVNFFQFNSYSWQQTTNNYTTIGQEVNQVTSLAITSGSNSSNTPVLLNSSSNHG